MNYSTLVSNIQNFLEDDSTELSNSIDQISQAEEMIFQRLPSLPCFKGIATGNLVIGTSEYTIPTARMIRQVSVTDSSSNVVYLNHRLDSYVRDYWPNSSTTATPEMYSTNSSGVAGTVVMLAPTPDATLAYRADYLAPETGLSSSNTTSWIGNNAENVLLSASLLEASAFLKAPETINLYKAQFDEAVQLFQQEMARTYEAEYDGGI